MTVEAGAAHGQQNPDDPVGWTHARPRVQGAGALSRMRSRRLQEADERKPNEPEILVEYAEALALAHGGNLDGEPMRLLERALKIDPNNPKALTLAGARRSRRRTISIAIGYWERLLGAGAGGFGAGAGAADGHRAGAPAGGREARRRAERRRQPATRWRRSGDDPRRGAPGRCARGPGRGRRTLCSWFARAAEGPRMPLAVVQQTGQGSAAAVHARRQHGDGAADEAVGFFQGDRDCAHLQDRQCHAAERRPARRERSRCAPGASGVVITDRLGGAVTAGLWMRRAGAAAARRGPGC